MPAVRHDFDIERELAASYFYCGQIAMLTAVGLCTFGIGVVVAIIHAFTLGPWLVSKQAAALHYWLEGSTLRVDEGVFFLKRKAIPLDRITDVVMVQGPLMRWRGIWGLRIQTAGAGQQMPEATLYGLRDAEGVRDLLLAERDKAATASRPIES